MAFTTIRFVVVVMSLCIALVALGMLVGTAMRGDEIAFVSTRSGWSEIYIMDVNRGFVQKLTALGTFSHNPAWSPDGTRVAFESQFDGEYGIWVVDASGHNAQRLIPGRGGAPDWSPDGAQIVFSSERDGNFEIYTASVDGSNIHRLTFDKASDFNPAWSPDGTRIIFQSSRNGYSYRIYSMDTDGGDLRLLSDKDSHAVDPAWSPNGTRIVFTSTQSGGKNLHLMDADGSHVQPLTAPTGTYDGSSSWTPDGARIAFDSDRYRNGYAFGWGIYVMNVDGNNTRLLTEGVRPVWRPRPG